jgi:uncharacterized protein (TIGR03437 family)
MRLRATILAGTGVPAVVVPMGLLGLLFTGLLSAQDRPVILAVVSSADFQAGIAFEGLASIFGTGLSDSAYGAASVPLPIELGQTQVRYCAPLSAVWDDCVPMELLYVGRDQINFRVSYGTRDESQTIYEGALVVRRIATLSDETRRQALEPVAPRIFQMGFDCNYDPAQADPSPCRLLSQRSSKQQSVRGALTDPSGALITSSNPARMGTVYSLWLTGLGRIANGQTPAAVQMLLGGIPVYGSSSATSLGVNPSFVGYSPQFAGLYQINFALPQNLMGGPGGALLHPCGDYRLELTLSLNEGPQSANPVQIPVLVRNGDVACAN